MITKKLIVFVMIVGLVGCLAIYFFQHEPSDNTPELPDNTPEPSGITQEPSDVTLEDETSGIIFEDEPDARALYDKMIETMCKAESISYKSDYKFKAGSKLLASCTYTAWIKKPNYIRIEAVYTDADEAGVLIGDGDYLWIYWPGERPAFSFKDQLDNNSEETRLNVYMKEATPTGKDSIRYKTSRLGAGMSVPVIDPSTFHGHGHTISRKPQIDGIKRIGTEEVRDIECDVIEVSFDKGQEMWQLWLSKEDHLPRKLKRVQGDILIDELWSDVAVNAEIPMEKFIWTPPQGWNQYHYPEE